jgi:thioredoxin reductase
MPGVFAAGDLAHQAAYPMPLASVLNAAAAGGLAAVAVLQELVADDYDLPPMG